VADGHVGVTAVLRIAAAVAARPRLWPVALRQGWRHCRRRSGLPRPSRDWIRFRVLTATGSPDGSVEPEDVVEYLEWCRRFPG
jgi:hypothetical protein